MSEAAFNPTMSPSAVASHCGVKLDAAALETLLAAVESSHSVSALELRNAGLTPSLVVQLADFLEQNATLTCVDLAGNNSIGVHGASCLAASLAKNSAVTRLSLAKCGLKSEALAPWIEVFQRATPAQTLAELNLSSNRLDEDCAESLAELIRTAQPTVSGGVHFDLRNNQLATASAKQIADAAQVSSAVVELKLGGNQDPDDGSDADALLKQHKRIEFYLRRNARDQQRRATLGRIQQVQHSSLQVQRCHFDYVDLSIADAEILANALRDNRSVTELRLRSNALPAEGARRIFLGLRTTTSVRSLAVVDNSIGDIGLRALATLLRHQKVARGRHPLQAVAISNSIHLSVANGLLQPITLHTASMLHHAFASYATLRSLSLANCALSDRDVGVIVSGVAWSACVQELDLRSNRFGDASAHVFAHLLRRCRLFSHLDLSGNTFTLGGTLPIALEAGEHPHLRVLVLGRFRAASAADATSAANLVCDALRRSFSLARVQLAASNAATGADIAACQVAALNEQLARDRGGDAALALERNARAQEDALHARRCRFRALVRRTAERVAGQLISSAVSSGARATSSTSTPVPD